MAHDGAWRSAAVAAVAAAAAASSPRCTVGTQCPSVHRPLPPVRPAPRHAAHRTRHCSRVTMMMTMMTMSMTGQWQWYDSHSRKYCPELSAQASAVAALTHAHALDGLSRHFPLLHPPPPPSCAPPPASSLRSASHAAPSTSRLPLLLACAGLTTSSMARSHCAFWTICVRGRPSATP